MRGVREMEEGSSNGIKPKGQSLRPNSILILYARVVYFELHLTSGLG